MTTPPPATPPDPAARPAVAETAVCAVVALPVPPAPADGAPPPARLRLLPGGGRVIPGDARPAWTIDDPAALAARSLAAAPSGLLVIDYDHAADLAAPKGGAAPAAGWITGLSVDADGAIVADVEWTMAGARALAAREYRFISPAFSHTPDRRVIRITGAGLVNRPALPQLPQLAHVQPTTGDTMDATLAAVLAALGLPAGADAATAAAAVAALKAPATPPDLTALCPADATADALVAAVTDMRVKALAYPLLTAQVATLSQRVQAAAANALETEIDAAIAARRFLPSQRAELVALAAAAPDLFRALTAKAVPHLATPSAAPFVSPGGSVLSPEEKAVCAALGQAEADYLKARATQENAR